MEPRNCMYSTCKVVKKRVEEELELHNSTYHEEVRKRVEEELEPRNCTSKWLEERESRVGTLKLYP